MSTTKTIPTKAYVSSISSFITAMEQVVHIWILDLVIMIMCSLQSSLFLYIGTNIGNWIKPIIPGRIWNTSTCEWSNIMTDNKNN